MNEAVFKVSFLLIVVAVKVTGVCHSSHQKQLAAKVAEGGGLLEEVDGTPEVGGGGGGGGSLQHKHSGAGGLCAGMKKWLQLQRWRKRDGSKHS